MVMSLPKPGICSVQLVDDVVEERQNGRHAAFFTEVAAEWKIRVEEFIEYGGSPVIVTTWPAIEGMQGRFLNLYLSPQEGSVQGVMLAGLRADHDLIICPACGEAGRPNTLDHYLPKSAYPHFAVTPVNLFPMCDACQRAKGAKIGNAQCPRFFLHPYFDVFVAEQVLFLVIEPPYNTPTFRLYPHPDLTVAQTALVTSHVRELEIERRYAHFFRSQHRRLLRLVATMRATGQDVVSGLTAFRASNAYPSENSWEHIFYSSVLNNPDLLAYLEMEQLPEYL